MTQKPLTPNQAIILWHMAYGPFAEDGPFGSTGDGARLHGFGVLGHSEGGIVFRAYSDPLYFLHGRGFVEPQQRNVQGRWYRLTQAGRLAAPTEKPKIPQPNPYSDFGRRR